jgi:hypothetical protein
MDVIAGQKDFGKRRNYHSIRTIRKVIRFIRVHEGHVPLRKFAAYWRG